MKERFINSISKKGNDYTKIFKDLYEGVVETNKLTGLHLPDMSASDISKWVKTYNQFRIDEIEEMEEAYDKEDKNEFLKELIDILVVAGYQYYLEMGEVYTGTIPKIDIESAVNVVSSTKSLLITLQYTQAILVNLGCDLESAVEAVLLENLSKFCTLGDLEENYTGIGCENLSDEELLIWQAGMLDSDRYSGITYEEVVDIYGDTRYIFFCSEEYGVPVRKYLKACSYKKCNLTNMWDNW